jgi:hypothetical protein
MMPDSTVAVVVSKHAFDLVCALVVVAMCAVVLAYTIYRNTHKNVGER